MLSKERVIKSLNHQTPDKIPVDFGSTPVTGIHVLTIGKLREYFGLGKKAVKVIEPYQMLGEIDEELQEIIGIDIIGISPRNTMFGFPNENWKECKTFWGQTILVPEQFNTTTDKNGDLVIYPEGDTSVAPSGKMSNPGYFFNAIIRQEPIKEDNLNPEDNLEEFSSISDDDLKYWVQQVNKVATSGKAVIANFGGTAFGDIALVPGLNLKHPKGIRDVTEWYMSTVIRQNYMHAIFEKQSEIAIENLTRIFVVVGNNIDVVFICGTDFGTQNSQFCSIKTFQELYSPYYRKINNWIHKNTTWKTFKHSCGAVEPFMTEFINSGFDIINPVQISARDMDSQHLKKQYGDKIVYWGGGVDTQKVLPFGTPEQVKQQVLEQCEILSVNGGFIFNTVHNIQANVPVENIVAMFNALKTL